MTAPRRPEPERTPIARVREQLAGLRARWGSRRELRELTVESGGQGSRPFNALIALGSALATIGALWAWQAWNAPAAPQVDDLMPFLVADEPGTDEPGTDEPGTDEPGTDGGEVTATPPSQGPEPSGVPQTFAAQGSAEPTPTPAVAMVVHVSGAVLRPGVVQLAFGSRVFEAVDEAGGASADADLDRVNLAAPIVDGERIHVPAIGEGDPPPLVPTERPATASATGTGSGETESALIDINSATAAELEELPGVGPATAAAIVATREARGPFRAIDDLLEVTGIGERKLEVMRPHVWIQAP